MAGVPWSPDEVETVRRLAVEEGLSDHLIAKRLPGRSRSAVSQIRDRYEIPAGSTVRKEAEDDVPEGTDLRVVVSPPSPRVVTLDQLLDTMEVDTAVWNVKRWKPNKYEQGAKLPDGTIAVTQLFGITAWLEPHKEALDLLRLEERILQRIADHAPAYPDYPPATYDPADAHMLEVAPFDLHIGKLAWKPETGENYDSGIARNRLRLAIEDVLAKSAGFNVEKILLPVGNDLLHADTSENTTTAGTRQDVDSRHHKMFVRAEEVMIEAIDRLMQIAPVQVIVVPGNHDRNGALKLGRVLNAWYRNTERVKVDAGPSMRKYVRYGVNLLGFTHGSEEKERDLPLIMATERPDDWAACQWREMHIGHWHKKREMQFVGVDEWNGVRVRVLPSLSGTDAWHAMRGYAGRKAVEAYLWSREGGYVGHFSANARAA